MAQPRREFMASRGGLSHLLGTLEDLRRPLASFGVSPFGGSLVNGSQWFLLLGRLAVCIYTLGEPWGMLHLTLHEIFIGREANLVSINSASSRFSWFAALPCRHHISHVRTPNNANLVSRLWATKLCSNLVLIAFLGNEDKIVKTASEDNLSDFGLVCATGI
jgi:hypothetical protein